MNIELNKIFAAVLLAGVIAMITSFVGGELDAPRLLEKDSYVVAGAPAEAPSADAAPAAEAIPPVAALLVSADAGNGQAVAKVCQSCHNFDKGGPNKIGPNLWGIVGNTHAHKEDFSYSTAIAGMKGQPWTYEELNKFLAGPKNYAPGTKMSFAGLAKPQQRADVIAWLRTLSDTPEALPKS